jgi:putative component of membrane protein insertase Oxa1/YidC/SpoIIIJ protein YidD
MNPARHALIFAIHAYRWTVSPVLVFLFGSGGGCRFTPSCSQYAVDAIRRLAGRQTDLPLSPLG